MGYGVSRAMDSIKIDPDYFELTPDNASPNTLEMRRKIIHVLTIYPRISSVMLQMGVGTNKSPRYWRPALTELREAGIVQHETIEVISPNGRYQRHTIL